MLVNTMIIPLFDYGNVVWGDRNNLLFFKFRLWAIKLRNRKQENTDRNDVSIVSAICSANQCFEHAPISGLRYYL